MVEDFTYLGSTISSNLSLHSELNKRIGKPVAAPCLAHLGKRVYDNTMFTISTKIQMYQACVLSTLLYGHETYTLYYHQERRLNTFHLRFLRRILSITGQDRVLNKDFLAQAGVPRMFALLSQRQLRWLGHVSPIERIPKEILYGELKRDLKAGNINPAGWEAVATDRSHWRLAVKAGTQAGEERRERRRLREASQS